MLDFWSALILGISFGINFDAIAVRLALTLDGEEMPLLPLLSTFGAEAGLFGRVLYSGNSTPQSHSSIRR